jgi:hypothetical protein
MLQREIIAVFSQIHTQYIRKYIHCVWQNVELQNMKSGGTTVP